jgi:hypothetical protein
MIKVVNCIEIDVADLFYDRDKRTFVGSEKNIEYSTSYRLVNHKTGRNKVFEFNSMTGSEWEPDTVSIYKCGDLTLEVHNDPDITETRKQAYIRGKMGEAALDSYITDKKLREQLDINEIGQL